MKNRHPPLIAVLLIIFISGLFVLLRLPPLLLPSHPTPMMTATNTITPPPPVGPAVVTRPTGCYDWANKELARLNTFDTIQIKGRNKDSSWYMVGVQGLLPACWVKSDDLKLNGFTNTDLFVILEPFPPLDMPTVRPTETPTVTATTTPTKDLLKPTNTPTVTPTRTKVSLPASDTPSPTPTSTSINALTPTVSPNVTETLQAAFDLAGTEFPATPNANIAFAVPEKMKLDEKVVIHLILDQSRSQDEVATQLVQQSGFPTSIVIPGQPVTDSGENVVIVTDKVVEISDHIMAVLKAEPEGAFDIQSDEYEPVQIIRDHEATTWSWSIIAKKEGKQTLVLVLYRLITYGNEQPLEKHWPRVAIYRKNVTVNVTPMQTVRSWDWKWILGILITALLVPLFFRIYDNRRKAANRHEPPKRRYRS